MLIPNVLARLADPTGFGQHREAADAVVSKAADALAPAVGSPSSSSRLREILTDYDVTDITPKAFSEMLQKLQESGLIPDKDLQELSQIRADMDREGVADDERVNLVEMYAKRIRNADEDAQAEAAGSEASVASLRRRLDWLEKFAAIHASPEPATINALA